MSKLIAGISGVRGIVGESLTPGIVVDYGSAFAEYCLRKMTGKEKRLVVIGYDGRPSGRTMADIARGTAAACGFNVLFLGMVPTPTVQLAVEKYKAVGGISITASHNPDEWNGMKFIGSTGIFLDHAENGILQKILGERSWRYVRWDDVGEYVQDKDFVMNHVRAVLRIPGINISAIRAKQFSVVVDAVNASGSRIVQQLLRRLNCAVVPLFCDGSGRFPHPPEPVPANLARLGEAVREHHADLGIAVDPDTDRLVLYTDQGEPYGEEYTITTAVAALLGVMEKPAGRSVVINLSTTRAVEEVAARFKATVHRTPVGEINVVRKMQETGALIGGEGSGGVIVPAVHLGRDALAGIVLVLAAFSEFHGTVSEYRDTLPRYAMTKRQFTADSMDIDRLLRRAAEVYAKREPNVEDGIRIDFGDAWVHLRASNTEPIIRVIAEAASTEEAEGHADEVIRSVTAMS